MQEQGTDDDEMELMFEALESGRIEMDVHLVIWTQGCGPNIDQTIRERFHTEVKKSLRREGTEPIAVGGGDNHLHALVQIDPEQSIEVIARMLMSSSSEWIGWQVPGFAWTDDYAAFTVSPWEIERERSFIERQEEHHRKVSFREELEQLLAENGISYSPDELWN
jgi:putative transposase